MTVLSVNINKVATLRNARGENMPDVQKFAVDCESFGAQGITVHPRPDERHITRDDVYKLRPLVKTGSISKAILRKNLCSLSCKSSRSK